MSSWGIRVLLVSALVAVSSTATAGTNSCRAPRGWGEVGKTSPPRFNDAIRLSKDGSTYWNGISVREDQVAQFLNMVSRMRPIPVMILDPGDSDCGRVKRFVALVEKSVGCTATSCLYGQSANLPVTAPPPPPPPSR